MASLPRADLPRADLPSEDLISHAAAALAQPGAQELAVITFLRSQGHDPDAVRLALEQVELRNKATGTWKASGNERQNWFFTRDGLEAASHPLVAQFHADVISQSDVTQVIDLTAGLGSDSAAFIKAGLETTAVEQDPDMAQLLAHNLPDTQILIQDCTKVDVTLRDPHDTAIFIDPARRGTSRSPNGARALPERDPERWSPPLSFVTELANTLRVFMKAAPAFNPPGDWAQFVVSLDGNVVEMFATNAATGTYAVMINSEMEEANIITQSAAPITNMQEVINAGGFLYELDPAITRAGLTQQVAGELGLTPVGEKNIWLFGQEATPFAHARAYQVHDIFPTKELRQRVKHLPGIALKTKDGRRELKELRKASAKPDHNEWAVVILGTGADEQAVLVQRERLASLAHYSPAASSHQDLQVQAQPPESSSLPVSNLSLVTWKNASG